MPKSTTTTRKPAKPAATVPAPDKPKRFNHSDVISRERYTGPSPLIRARAKSARVMLNATCDNFTDRTRAAMLDLRDAYADKPFLGANADAGILRQLIALGYAAHVTGTGHVTNDGDKRYASGDDCRFTLTSAAIAYGKPVAKPGA